MKLPEHEIRAHRDAFKAMSLGEKAEYIFAYYKLPLVIALIVVVFLVTVTYRTVTHRDEVIYVAYANVVIEEDANAALTDGYLAHAGIDARHNQVYCYQALYLTDSASTPDHQYAYASRLKLLAAIEAAELDIVIMDRQAYDLLSHSGMLLDLSALLAEHDEVSDLLSPYLVSNEVIIEDNQIEVDLNEADTYEAVTREDVNAIDISSTPLFNGFTGEVYVGVITNSPRIDTVVDYLCYLFEASLEG